MSQQIFDELEKTRKSIVKSIKISIGIGAGLGIIIFIFLGIFNSFSVGNIIPSILFAAVVTGIIGIQYYGKLKEFRKHYKTKLVQACLDEVFTDISFTPKQTFSQSYIDSLRLIKTGNKFSGDDYIKAKYKGVDFMQSDLCSQHVVRSGKTTTTYTYFYGKWMVFDFHKPFSEYVQIIEKGGFGSDITVVRPSSDKVEFEDIQFNKEFRVFATNQHTAFYLMTPQFIENLRILRDKTKGTLIVGFVNGCLHVGVNSKRNSLEPSIFKAIDFNTRSQIMADISVITDFVDGLDLVKSNRIYKMADENETNTNKTKDDDIFDL